MTLTPNLARTEILVSSTLLDSFVANPANYVNITIRIYYNSLTDSTVETYTDASPLTSSTNVSTLAGVEKINPAFFSGTEFQQGVYHVLITLTAEGEIQTDEGCVFVEDDLACTIDTYRLNETNQTKKLNAGLDYFLLKNLQDCSCQCEGMIEIYNNLININNKCKTC